MIMRSELADVLIDMQAIIIARIDSGEIIYATPVAEELFGMPIRNGLIGMIVDQLVPIDRQGIHKGHRAEFQKNPRRRVMGTGQVLEGKRLDSSRTFPVQIALAPTRFAFEPKSTMVVAIVVDASVRTP